MADYIYAQNNDLSAVAQEKMQTLSLEDPIFKYFPIETKDTSVISWEQEDADTGLQQIRGINGAPKVVQATGSKRYTVEPGVFGEFRYLDEKELTERRRLGTHGDAMNINDMITKAQDRLLGREYSRIKQILYLLVAHGQYTLSKQNSNQVIYFAAFTFPSYTATVPWSTPATSTPLADIRNLMLQGLDLVTDADFGSDAELFVNQKKVQHLLANTNANDIGGRFENIRSDHGLDAINAIMVAEGLPRIVPISGNYVDENGVVQRYMPDNAGTLFGSRREPMGSYTMTRNASNDNAAPGSYSEVIEEKRPPKSIEVHQGHNGGAEIHFGKSIQRLANI